MNILTPIDITDAMIGAGTTVAEPAAGETTWVSAGTYALGDKRIRTTTHRVYECVQAHTGRTALPEVDGAYWLDIGPTQRWSPFDIYTSTQAAATTSMTYVLSPGFFNALALYGVLGTQYSITVKDAPAGAVIYTRTGYLYDDPTGWYEYLFGGVVLRDRLLFRDIPIRPTAELTLTISAASGQPVGIGLVAVGDYANLYGADWGGTQYGASAEPVTYSYIKTEEDGTTKIVRRHSAVNMRANVIMPKAAADDALIVIRRVLDKPVAWIASDAPGYGGLNVFGLGSASLSYASPTHASLDINVKGMI